MIRKLFLVFWSLSLYCSALDAAYDPEMMWLSWLNDPTTTMTIQWVDHAKDPHTTVEYRLSQTENWQNASAFFVPFPGIADLQIKRVELTSLQPKSNYEFRIGSDGVVYQFRTLPQNSSDKVVFVEGGDMFHDDLETMENMSRVAAQQNPHFVVIGGDLAYSSGSKLLVGESTERWIAWLRSMKRTLVSKYGFVIPILPAIGNHEVNGGYDRSPSDAKLFYASFPLPPNRAYRVLDFGNYLSLFLLDSGHTAPVSGVQRRWLIDSLATRTNRPLKFAVYHVPAYPSIRRFESRATRNVRDSWVPVFDYYGVQVAFEHHDHAYKRSLRLKNNKPHPNGTLYMGDGCWGIKQPRVNNLHKWYIANYRSARNVLAVTIENDKYKIQAFNEQGEVFDEVTSPDLQLREQSGQTLKLAPAILVH